jgi:DNA repair protein RadC
MKYKIKYKLIELLDGEKVRSPQDIYNLTESFRHDIQEYMFIYGLCNSGDVRLVHTVIKGSSNKLMLTPKDLVMPLLHNGLYRAILCHNHPSGDLVPSSEDLSFTKKVKEVFSLLGLELVDHLIVSPLEGFYSFKANNLI